MEQKNTFYVIIALLFGFVIGFFAGQRTTAPVTQTATSPNVPVSSPSSFLVLPSDMNPRSVSGKIALLNNSVITLHAMFVTNTLMNVIIGKDTKIIRLVPKDPQAYRDEIVAYNKAVPKPAATPSAFREISAQASDLHPGDSITAAAADVIKDQTSFTATEIRILPKQ